MPEISVVIPARNAGDFIDDAFASLGAQTFADFEAIVIDDGSTDATAERVAVAAKRDARIRPVPFAARGLGHARNCGLDAARGTWVTFLDADDWYHPQRLERLHRAAARHGRPLCADNQWFIDAGCARPWRRLVEDGRPGERRIATEEFLRRNPIGVGFRPGLGLFKPFVRRSFLDQHRIRFQVDLGHQEDFLFLLHCLAHAEALVFLDTPTYYYRQHRASRVHNLRRSDFEVLVRANEAAIALFPRAEDAAIRAALRARVAGMRRRADSRAVVEGLRALARRPSLVADLLAGGWATGVAAVRRRLARLPALAADRRGSSESAHDVEPAVDVQHGAGDRGCQRRG
jgi:glycosyltransferase involved in cell wall biosynthesis